MKKTNKFISALIMIFSVAAIAGCSKSAADKPADAPEKVAAPTKAGVTIDAETQARIGLKMEAPAAREWQPEMKVYGRVIDPAPLTELLTEFARTLMVFDTSHQELERAKQLRKDSNISEKVFQEAEATYRQNFLAVTVARQKIEATWGKQISKMFGEIVVPPGTPRKMDSGLDELTKPGHLIRLDLPVGERRQDFGVARIEPLAQSASAITASYFDALPAVDALTQQSGVLFLQTAGRLVPGEAVTGYLKTSGEPVAGVVVPSSAVLRHEGKGWIYVQTETNQFVRREIPLDRLMDDGWFVSENLSATNRIVVSGAQTILSAELSGGGFLTGARD